MIDVAKVNRWVQEFLRQKGYRSGDADGTDFRKGGANAVRFKTGTSRGEVAITVWKGPNQIDVVRILNEDQSYDEGVKRIAQHIQPKVNPVDLDVLAEF